MDVVRMTVTRPPGNDVWRWWGARRDNFGGSGIDEDAGGYGYQTRAESEFGSGGD
jgi:hypothetical protein